MDLNTQKPKTEAEALQDIVSWSIGRPLWQRDALRRLCDKPKLTENDIEELILIASGNKEKVQPLSHSDVPSVEGQNKTLNLGCIKDVFDVNALANDQCLSFNKGNGVTIVYGDNGSGKSGYARILKSACRARMKSSQYIIPNIYSDKPGNPRATIKFSLNGQNRVSDWQQGVEPDPILSSVSVFDSNTANIHVDEKNDVAYTPFSIKLLSRLSDVCDTIQKRIKREILELDKQAPDSVNNPKCKNNTKVGKIVNNLNSCTDKEMIIALANISEEEEKKYKALRSDLEADPGKEANKLNTIKIELESYYTKLKSMAESSSTENLKIIQQKLKEFEAKKKAANIAAESLFKGNYLPDVGSEVWRSLWEAAREYSNKIAYPGTSFPNTGSNAKCVLCQQELASETVTRLINFENFVKDESNKQKEVAEREYTSAINALKETIVSQNESKKIVNIIGNHIGASELSIQYRKTLFSIKRRVRQFLRNQSGLVDELPLIKKIPNEEHNNQIDNLENRISNFTAEKNSEKYQRMISEFDELKDRKWLKYTKNDLISQIDREVKKSQLKQILTETKTTAISNKSTELAKYLITNALRAQFAIEINKLKLGDLAVELCHAGSTLGKPLFTVSLIRKPDESKISNILSEGEFRCIALAAFFAEQVTTKSKATLVLDDPVCSLDHMHREQIADRIADEASDRQIIIFTHDLAFLFLLEGICREKGVNVAHRWVLKTNKTIGLCRQDSPPKAQSIDRALDSVEADLNNQSYLYEQGKHKEWIEKITSYQNQLRKLWERAVEESVAPVVKRFRNKVDINGLSKITVINNDDYQIVKKAYGRISTLNAHSDGDELNRPMRDPTHIQNEIIAIREWITSVKNRQNGKTN